MTATLTARTSYRLWLVIYLVGVFGTAALAKTGVVPGWPGTIMFLCSFLLLFPFVRAVQRLQAGRGSLSKAMKAYNRRVLLASILYVVLLFGGLGTARYFDPPVAVRAVLAVLVALPVIMMIGAMAKLLKEESDEYLRMRIVEQVLIGTGIVLAVATLYGFLNTFDLAPRVDAWAVVPVWALGIGAARLFQRDPSC